jgi:hypothetical protein
LQPAHSRGFHDLVVFGKHEIEITHVIAQRGEFLRRIQFEQPGLERSRPYADEIERAPTHIVILRHVLEREIPAVR